MQKNASSPMTGTVFLALKGLATVGELAILGGVIYAAAMAARYWPSIGV